MIKPILMATVASLAVPAAFAGPYINTEINSSYTGSDYTNATTDLHVGWEGDISDSASYFIQGGPAIVAVDGTDNDTQLSGKLGGNVDLSEKLGIYSISFIYAKAPVTRWYSFSISLLLSSSCSIISSFVGFFFSPFSLISSCFFSLTLSINCIICSRKW